MAKVSEDNLDLLKNKFQETIMTYYPTFFFGRTRVYINTYDVSTRKKSSKSSTADMWEPNCQDAERVRM